jgi:hypothetical protein
MLITGITTADSANNFNLAHTIRAKILNNFQKAF